MRLIRVVHVKDTEANPGFGQVPTNGDFYSGESVIGKDVSTRNDGQNIYSRREPADGLNLHWRESGSK